MHPRGKVRCAGFAPVELLLVVSVLSMILLLVLPMMRQVQTHQTSLVCLGNLRVQGMAQAMYTADYDGWFPSGLMTYGSPNDGSYCEYGSTHWAYLPYMGYQNEYGDLPTLWRPCGSPREHRLSNAFFSIPEYQCPQHPDATSPLDYVVNSMPIPFTVLNLSVPWEWGLTCSPVGVGTVDEVPFRNVDTLAATIDLSAYICITEANPCLNGPDFGLRFNAFFLGSHLPFAGSPRIANDQRHPYGLSNLFFDGHVQGLALHELDPGYPNAPVDRLRYFSPCNRPRCFDSPPVPRPDSPNRIEQAAKIGVRRS